MCDLFSYYPSGIFPSSFQTKIFYVFFIPIVNAAFTFQLILLDLVPIVMIMDYEGLYYAS
jgi:hypothetical protein